MKQKTKLQAIEVLKQILQALHEERFSDVTLIVDESKIENLEEFLEFVVKNHFESVDEYGVFVDDYDFEQMTFYEYDDGSGFEIEYEMTSDSAPSGMILQLEFLYLDNDSLKCIFAFIDPK